MNDARAQHTSHPDQIPAVVEQCVDEGATGVSGSGVDDQARRFIDDDHLLVLVQNVEGDCLGSERRGQALGRSGLEGVPHPELAAGGRGIVVHAHQTGVDPAPPLRARDPAQHSQHPIEALPRLGLSDDENELLQRRPRLRPEFARKDS